MSAVLDRDGDNPRIQCSRCGQWSRLYKNEEQNHFPGCIDLPDGTLVEIYWDVCGKCGKLLDSIMKDLVFAYQAGQSNKHREDM